MNKLRDSLKDSAVSFFPVAVLLLVTIFFQFVSKGSLLSPRNVIALTNQMFTIILGASGMAFMMAQGSLDFSIGSVVGLSAVMSAYASWVSLSLIAPVAIGVGALCGFISGFIHAKYRISAIITTISLSFVYRGLAIVSIESGSISVPLKLIGIDKVQLKAAVMLIIVGISAALYCYSKLGKQSKAIGAGEEAAFQTGVQIKRLKILAFTISGSMAGLIGSFSIIRAASASTNTGTGMETDVLIALLLGGMPISGGANAKFRSVILGSMILTILSNGMILWGLDMMIQQLIKGIIFLIAVTLSFDRKNLAVIV